MSSLFFLLSLVPQSEADAVENAIGVVALIRVILFFGGFVSCAGASLDESSDADVDEAANDDSSLSSISSPSASCPCPGSSTWHLSSAAAGFS